MISSSYKNLFVSLAVALAVSALIGGAWAISALESLEAVFMRHSVAVQNTPPQTWVSWLLIFAAGAGAAFAVERNGGRRALRMIALALILLCVTSLAASHMLHVNTLFAPMMLAALSSGAAVQIRRLWIIDAALTANVTRVALQNATQEVSDASARLASGLKLLDTVLPLEDAVIFRLDRAGKPAPSARLRQTGAETSRSAGDNRNNTWRDGVLLCERAISSGEIIVQSGSQLNGVSDASTVALPLNQDGRPVGALLLRMREKFEETDRPLLLNVSAQFARNLQRDGARALRVPTAYETLTSVPASEQRLESFSVVSGLLTEDRFATRVLTESKDGVAVAYLDGTLACVNDAMLVAAQLTTRESRGLDLFGLLDCFRQGVFDDPSIAVRRVLQTGEAYDRELNFTDRDQTLALSITLVTEAEETQHRQSRLPDPLCLAVTVRDVTRIKEYEKLKSDMLSLMSHELRTPITSINGFAELLAGDNSLPADAREFLSIINNESQRLMRMINTFLSVTKLEQKDRQEVFISPLLLDDIMRDTIGTYQPIAKRKRIRLIEKDGVRLPPIAADRGMITQAVANLVDNAIKYSPERTAVTLSATLEVDSVKLTVEDRGFGIPPEDVERVWEKFYRVARDGMSKEDESTGLGLSFVREVIERHGGEVFLESEVGHGSRFGFTLPRM